MHDVFLFRTFERFSLIEVIQVLQGDKLEKSDCTQRPKAVALQVGGGDVVVNVDVDGVGVAEGGVVEVVAIGGELEEA